MKLSYGASVRRRCNTCGGKGETTCWPCSGKGRNVCKGRCGGRGIVSCPACSASGKVSCTDCKATGIQYKVWRGVIHAATSTKLVRHSATNAVLAQSLIQHLSMALEAAKFDKALSMRNDQNGSVSYSYRLATLGEVVSIDCRSGRRFTLAATSKKLATVSLDRNLDELLVPLAEEAASGIGSLSDLREKAPNLPEVARWALGAKLNASEAERADMFYAVSISSNGCDKLKELKKQKNKELRKSMAFEARAMAGFVSMFGVFGVLANRSLPNGEKFVASIAIIAFAFIGAELFSRYYVWLVKRRNL